MISDQERKELAERYNSLGKQLQELAHKVADADVNDVAFWVSNSMPGANDEWIKSVQPDFGSYSNRYENTLSWRITKPLRVASLIRNSVRSRGIFATFNVAAKRIKSRLEN